LAIIYITGVAGTFGQASMGSEFSANRIIPNAEVLDSGRTTMWNVKETDAELEPELEPESESEPTGLNEVSLDST
jgi:hypothetical protein